MNAKNRMSPSRGAEGSITITYKRRKRRGSSIRGAISGPFSTSASAPFSRGGGGDHNAETGINNAVQGRCGAIFGRHARIEQHWRNVLERIVESVALKDHGIQSRMRRALARGLFGVSTQSVLTKLYAEDRNDTCQNAENGTCNGNLKATQSSSSGPADADIISRKCQDVVFDILLSQKFAALCDFLCENFQDIIDGIIFDFGLIFTKMMNGAYSQSAKPFNRDIKLAWKKVRMVGDEISLLATDLLSMSETLCHAQIRKCLANRSEKECEGTKRDVPAKKGSLDQHVAISVESDHLRQVEVAGELPSFKVCRCQICGLEADVKDMLACDQCEVIYHISCIKPTILGIPTGSWYCASCLSKKEVGGLVSSGVENCLHQGCVACAKLENLDDLDYLEKDSGSVTSVHSMNCLVSNTDEKDPSRISNLRLCKVCGECEDEDKRFLICSNVHCLYKYYHIRCLQSSQLASRHQKPGSWYCPSCLCRTCLTDKDDDLICMCDGCDEAYHIYCMKPPQTSIPVGMWHCYTCNLKRIKETMRKHEQSVLQQHSENDKMFVSGNKQPMEMLLSAAEKLSAEEMRMVAVSK